MAEHYILFEVGQPPEIRRNMQMSISKEISRTDFAKLRKLVLGLIINYFSIFYLIGYALFKQVKLNKTIFTTFNFT